MMARNDSRTSGDRDSSSGAGRQQKGGHRFNLPKLSDSTRRRVIWGGGILVALILLFLMLRPSRTTVETATASEGRLEVTITSEGRTRVVDRFTLVAPVTGTLARVELDPGDAVSSGTVVARIHPATSALLDPRTRADAIARHDAAESRVTDATAALTRARGDLEFAERELARVRTLAQAGALAPREVEEAERAHAAASAGFTAAEGALRAAQAERQAAAAAVAPPEALGSGDASVSVRAPSGGQILRVHERGPRLVQAGSPLIDVGDPASLEIVADFLTQDAVRVAGGAPAIIVTGTGNLPARVRRVEPSAETRISALGVEEQRVDVILDFGALDGDGATQDETLERRRTLLASLGDGFRVDARIVVAERDNVLRIPTSAIFRHTERWATFVVNGGRAELRPVEIGLRSEQFVEVLGGVKAGEMVVMYPGDEVRDGSRVASERR